jgi:hypothetical protein
METKYKVRIVLTVILFIGAPIIYGLTDPSMDARFTLGAAMSIPLLVAWMWFIGLVGSCIERGVRFLLKR